MGAKVNRKSTAGRSNVEVAGGNNAIIGTRIEGGTGLKSCALSQSRPDPYATHVTNLLHIYCPEIRYIAIVGNFSRRRYVQLRREYGIRLYILKPYPAVELVLHLRTRLWALSSYEKLS